MGVLADLFDSPGLPLPCVPLSPNAKLPTQENDDDFGWDLYPSSVVTVGTDLVAVPTGLAMAIPRGFGAFLKERSGLARKQGVRLEGIRYVFPDDVELAGIYEDVSGGVIDAGYRGELIILLSVRPGYPPRVFSPADKVAQLIVLPRPRLVPYWAKELPPSSRGERGFGDSGGTGSPVPNPPSDPLPSLSSHATPEVPAVQDEYWPEKGSSVPVDASPDPRTADLSSGYSSCVLDDPRAFESIRGLNGHAPALAHCSCITPDPDTLWRKGEQLINERLRGVPDDRKRKRLEEAARGYPAGSMAQLRAIEEAETESSFKP